ncbi:hypothetical protein BDF14DRAFT_1878397 [Spinellus fusiger]|nr:hypothetical protein BDF14DRAFT_1878397 [Spinellus fusiger]
MNQERSRINTTPPHSTAETSPPQTNTLHPVYAWFDIALVFPNTISEARDHLANERNWLTLLRLSCTFLLLGLTVLMRIRLPDTTPIDRDFDTLRLFLGFLCIAVGLCLFFGGVGKYFINQHQLIHQTNTL